MISNLESAIGFFILPFGVVFSFFLAYGVIKKIDISNKFFRMVLFILIGVVISLLSTILTIAITLHLNEKSTHTVLILAVPSILGGIFLFKKYPIMAFFVFKFTELALIFWPK